MPSANRPPCYNRPPAAEGMWHPTKRKTWGTRPGQRWPKPVLRWHPRWFEDRCATHDGRGIGPKGESYPEAHGWDCAGCRWNPHGPSVVDKPVDNPLVIHIDPGYPTGRAILARQQEREKNQEWRRSYFLRGMADLILSNSLAKELGITAPYRNRA